MPLNIRFVTSKNRRSNIEILRDFLPTSVARMLYAPGLLPVSLVLKSTSTWLFVGSRGTAFLRALRFGGRVSDADTKIEASIHGPGEIKTSAGAEGDADFFGRFDTCRECTRYGGSDGKLRMDMLKWDCNSRSSLPSEDDSQILVS